MDWNRFVAQRVLQPPRCLVQVEAHFSFIQMLPLKGGQITSLACSIKCPSNVSNDAINRLSQIECAMFYLMNFQPLRKQKKSFQHPSSRKVPDADAIPAKICGAGGLPMAELNIRNGNPHNCENP